MAINQYTGQKLTVGEWVNLTSMQTAGIAGRCGLIVETRPKSISIKELRQSIDGTITVEEDIQMFRNSSVVFVSSSQEECAAVRQACRDWLQSEESIMQEQKRLANERKTKAINNILSGNIVPKTQPVLGSSGFKGPK